MGRAGWLRPPLMSRPSMSKAALRRSRARHRSDVATAPAPVRAPGTTSRSRLPPSTSLKSRARAQEDDPFGKRAISIANAMRATAQSPSRSFGSGNLSAPTSIAHGCSGGRGFTCQTAGSAAGLVAGNSPGCRAGPPMIAGFSVSLPRVQPWAVHMGVSCAVSTASSRPFRAVEPPVEFAYVVAQHQDPDRCDRSNRSGERLDCARFRLGLGALPCHHSDADQAWSRNLLACRSPRVRGDRSGCSTEACSPRLIIAAAW